MAAERVQTGGLVGRLPGLVAGYAGRVSGAVLEQHEGGSVSSALGVWLLLAACAPVAQGRDRAALEEALGCSAEDAAGLLAAFMTAAPPALKVALAVWARISDATAQASAWARGLPDGVQSGFMPSQAEADAWAERETLGLIRKFPLDIDDMTRIVLASALATKVSWEVPFEVVPSAEHCGSASPWRAAVSRLLWDGHAEARAMIARTEAAGVVAVHCAVAREDLTVVSVSGAPEVDRASVVAGAYEVAATVCGDWGRSACSLYDLPLGAGHSWDVSEREVPVFVAEPRLERIGGVALPAWRVEGELNLMRSSAFGTGPALETLRQLIGPRPDDQCQARQAALASFTRYGFEAAAVTALGVRASAARLPVQRSVERTAVLRFDHPYAAVAVTGRPPGMRQGPSAGPSPTDSPFPGLPLFTAWVHEPIEPEDHPPGS
ncbi:MAG TPA: hypothetical protein VHW96_12650 [Solirubrobacteraceae bacterium]|nr:hypothetical protein [Solirubrobacteraceae bacterium]